MSEHHDEHSAGFQGPKCWILSAIAGLIVGTVLAFVLPKPAVVSVADLAARKNMEEQEFLKQNREAIEAWEKDHGEDKDGHAHDHDAGDDHDHDNKPDEAGAEAPAKEEDGHGGEQEPAGDGADHDGHEHAAGEDHAREDGEHAGGGHGHGSKPVDVTTLKVPDIPLYLSLPFAFLLLSIALMPFISLHFWEHHFPDFAFFLGGIMVTYYLIALNGFTTTSGEAYGMTKMTHVGLEYFQFIALVGSLYVATGGVLIDIKGKAKPGLNILILAVGAVLANVIGTTGAAALLIRTFIRINKHRIRAFHVVFFIFIVANCGGCLTPIGDPPLFLGYLQGVPFQWTVIHLWPAWLTCVGMLLGIFFVLDTMALKKYTKEQEEEGEPAEPDVKNEFRITGIAAFFWIGVILFGVFFDQIFNSIFYTHIHGVGALVQIGGALAAYLTANKANLKANEFNFAPIEEVGFLFVGLFATMVPALDYLGANASSLGVNSPGLFYWATGALSSFLDNAPTYLNFLSAAHGLAGMEMGRLADTPGWMHLPTVGTTGHSAESILVAISLGAVFFGANTYIGNAPNFMVKAISESSGVKMPSFFGYVFAFAIPFLLPVLFIIYLLFT